MENRVQYFNNLRAVACFLVILTHSAMPALNPAFGLFMMLFSFISSPSSELFVTLSSSLLAPTKLGMFEFYKKRFSKLLGPFIFWSLIILLIGYFNHSFTFAETITKLILLPIQPVTGVYWFIYVIIGLYFIIPILSPWLQKANKGELRFIISLWILTLILPYTNLIFNKEIYSITGSYYFITSYLGGFVGYLFLGVYLRKFPIHVKSKFALFYKLFPLFIGALLPYFYGYIFNREALDMVRENLSLSSAFLVTIIFTFFQNIQLNTLLEKLFNNIAKYSFGIYLIHIIVVRDIIWKVLENHRLPHPIIETPIIAIISLICSFLIVKILSLMPYSKYIIGV
ncbi:acyltransferase [Faecalibacter rhinopitheci]|uniref:Acyltransferase n=1 Tax=Faecalibacter rhinopitheci TaxID=2779678 RepID=A0A8J7FX59_9FLAO|nr:acyltransferase [Faecalibacter rhinopitheci]MBF0598346.1 acyltransferase [Faecalibacter rhinopitheci]